MTRINLIPPNKLTDQHLLAEYRELPRIFGAVRSKLENGQKIEPGIKYKMGTGHVLFFYDKLGFLQTRFQQITLECKKRNFNISFDDYDISDIPEQYKNSFTPGEEDIHISQQRIDEKINEKPHFYKYYGKPLGNAFEKII